MTPAPSEVVIGLDAGTTAVKATAFGVDAPWRHTVVREYPLLQPSPDRAEQDPRKILSATGDALAECVAAVGGADVLALAIAAGMHGLLALDAEGNPLTPLITWADARATAEARALRERGEAEALHAVSGVPVHPMTPLAKLMWFARHDRVTWDAARWWVGLKELIVLWLTGHVATELSSASGTGLLDVSTRSWSAAALELSGVDADRLPELLPTTATLPLAAQAARRVGLPAGTTVVVGAADGPLGNLGTGAMAPGVAGLTLGTSGAIRTAVEGPRVDEGRTLFCYALTDSIWVVGGAISNGGVVVRWARDALAPEVGGATGSDAALLELAAGVPPGCEGLVMLPYLLLERASLWDPRVRGAYLGLRSEHTRAHLIRAAVEGVCLQMSLILDRLQDVAPVESVRATGGVFRAALWRDVMAAMLARPIQVVGDAEGTALGAAALGLFAVGAAPSLDEAVARLTEADRPAPPLEPDEQLVATYDRLRASIPYLIAALDGVARLLGGDGTHAARVTGALR